MKGFLFIRFCLDQFLVETDVVSVRRRTRPLRSAVTRTIIV